MNGECEFGVMRTQCKLNRVKLTSIEVSVDVDVMASFKDNGEFREAGESSPESMLDSLLLLLRIGSSTRPMVHGVCCWLPLVAWQPSIKKKERDNGGNAIKKVTVYGRGA